MNKLIFILIIISTTAFAGTKCFIAKENNKIIRQEGDGCDLRYAPCSTFKIALSLMGYDSSILEDEEHPLWPFKENYASYMDSWKQSHYPRLWMKNSNVWYSQVLTEKLGMNKFREYITKFNYGNKDVSGDIGKNNGLSRAWLSSSLEISPNEQLVFLQKLLNNELPVNAKSHDMTRKILFIEDLPNDWKLYGKTGSGNLLNLDRTKKLDNQIGWFVGWLEKNNRKIIYAYLIQDEHKEETYAGPRAKIAAKEQLLKIISNLDK